MRSREPFTWWRGGGGRLSLNLTKFIWLVSSHIVTGVKYHKTAKTDSCQKPHKPRIIKIEKNSFKFRYIRQIAFYINKYSMV